MRLLSIVKLTLLAWAPRSLVAGHQLKLCYTVNKRSKTPFNLVVGGENFKTSTTYASLSRQGFATWSNTTVTSSPTPWSPHPSAVYLCGSSPTPLSTINTETSVFVLGGLVDHTSKRSSSYNRATHHGLLTAHLPLSSALSISDPRPSSSSSSSGGSVDVSTLACFQLLHSRLSFPSWPLAIYNTPAFHSSPLRKYLRWHPPYGFLNDPSSGRPYRLMRGEAFELTPWGGEFEPPDREEIEEVKRSMAAGR